MMCKEKTACFTGHRELKENDFLLFLQLYRIVENLILEGYLYFGVGGARGFDLLVCKVIFILKEKYKNISLILVLPFINQYIHENNWTKEEIELYNLFKEKASKVVYVQKFYSKGCYYKRNRHLVNFSSVCIAYQYKMTGGTAYTVNYAENNNVTVIKL